MTTKFLFPPSAESRQPRAESVQPRAVSRQPRAVPLLVLFAGYLGSRALSVRETQARVRGLPPEWDGVRIVQISDVHVGPHTPVRFLTRVVRAVERLRPDVVAVTGDLVDDRREDVDAYARILGGLRAPSRCSSSPAITTSTPDGMRSRRGCAA